MGCKTLDLSRWSAVEFTALLFIGMLSAVYASDMMDGDGCSYHQTHSCHPDATCVDEPTGWKCYCQENVTGDGLKGDNHTGCGGQACKFSQECHTYGECNSAARCQCKDGYTGDGRECNDVDECLDPGRCYKYANCINTIGGYECHCDNSKGYYGDGKTCSHVCNLDSECNQNEACEAKVCVCKRGFADDGTGSCAGKCEAKVCVCKRGFADDGTGSCADVNECLEEGACDVNANCTNTEGSHRCDCRNGYKGDGNICEAWPKNCHEIKMAKLGARGGRYTIDPDGTGPLDPTEVVCKMRSNPALGITLVYPKVTWNRRVWNNKPTLNIDYTHTVTEIKAIIGTADFCYQYMRYTCRDGATLMDGDDYWMDGNGVRQENWGGASMDNKCACGQLGYCTNRTSPCNCDGNTDDRMIDDGKLIDKEKLPVVQVSSRPGSGRGYVKLGPVMCAPRTFDIPIDCDDAKFNRYYRIRKDGPQVVDIDGPKADESQTTNHKPLLVHCDMESFQHVGITVIPHSRPDPVPITKPGTFPVEYRVDTEPLTTLVSKSAFCTQEAGYTCLNSRLMNNGDKKGYFADTRGATKDYWPGGLQRSAKCGCAITQTCNSNNYGCNCDVADGVERMDFGVVTSKEDLPIGSLTFLEVGGGSNGTYYVGALKCANKEFGIPATCQDYLENGYNHSHTYLVDPDGPQTKDPPDEENQDAFPVYCEMMLEPPYAKTIVYHDTHTMKITGNIVIEFKYRNVIDEQLEALVKKAVTCSQTVSYKCKSAPLHVDGANLTTWQTTDGRSLTYLAGDGSEPVCACGLAKPNQCDGHKGCNCDTGDGVDNGPLTNKADLPVMTMTFDGIGATEGEADLVIGPLVCRELFPTCADMKTFNQHERLVSETVMKNGYYTIDPDGEEGVEPFVVECMGTKTTVPVDIEKTPTEGDPDKPVSKCYTITYSSNGYPVSPEQVMALVENSAFCGQELTQMCLNAPVTGYSNFTTCDGREQAGWAGSKGKDKCSCGVTGSCAGGKDALCNCDEEDGKLREDGGWILAPNRLAVCEVCVGLGPLSSLPPEVPQQRTVNPFVSDLFCDGGPLGKAKSCQDWRNQGMTESNTRMLDPDGSGPMEPTPFYCSLQVNPPLGWTEIYPKEPEIEVPNTGTEVVIEYFVYSFEVIKTLIEKSGYCTQELFIECLDSSLELTGTYGWYSRDGDVQSYWGGNEAGTPGCAGGACNCNLGGNKTDGGQLIDDDLLPITKIKLGPADGTRTLKIGPLKCFDLYVDCEDIRKHNARVNPLRDNTYTIDPDHAGGVGYFAVTCDFSTERTIGITKVEIIPPESSTIQGAVGEAAHNTTLEYKTASPDQIHALAEISGYCHQGIQYTCYKSPLINSEDPLYSYYSTYGGGKSLSFGVPGADDTVGCACVVTKTCPDGHSCHCDAIGKMTVDYGYVTNTSLLPIAKVSFGGQEDPDASAAYRVTDVRCGPRPFDLPEDCDDAYHRGIRASGEVLILPDINKEPFLVYCDMKTVPNAGVTVIGHDMEVTSEVKYGETRTPQYNGADIPQIIALTKVSNFCYQAIKYDCLFTEMLSGDGYFLWKGGRNSMDRKYLGPMPDSECSCGKQNKCGGSEQGDQTQLNILRDRSCNCDAADNQSRSDAGVFNSTYRLPVKLLKFEDPGIEGATGNITLGKLYCTKVDHDIINECKTGFNDCHEHAKCINKHGDFECECKSGWRGGGRKEVWANGRNCYDDDECAMHMCPWSADCYNFPGSFECVCKEGFNQIGPRKCQDIDECALNTHNCDENARCINLIGSFDCKCNRNYRGNGTSCEPLALCSCFGDVHCLTFDDKLVDYQGTCEYIMARDRCDNFGSTPTFELRSNFHDRGLVTIEPASWVKEVTFSIYNFEIKLRQGNEIWLNGLRISAPYNTSQINIRAFGKYVDIYTDIGVEVSWDGEEAVELYTPGAFREQTCGLCGNYNGEPQDDLIVGPQCPQTAGQQTNNYNIFGNSWVIPDPTRPECDANCTAKNDTGLCTGLELTRAQIACQNLFSYDGMFGDCLREMDESIIEMHKYTCEYDACRVAGDLAMVICDIAEKLVTECINNYAVKIEDFRKKGFCEMDCGVNMTYDSCGSPNQPTCSDMITNSLPDFTIPMCLEGCFCKDGYMLDGQDKCVKPEDCGCVYTGTMTYLKLGETLTIDECNTQVECQRNNTVTTKGIVCHENATCRTREGIFGCHCNHGYYGDGVFMCREDPCLKDPCGVNETCTRSLDNSKGYDCACQMGFMGECGSCEEIDECQSRTDECEANTKCVNTIGSYECPCKEGFQLIGGKCEDENECEIEKLSGIPLCGNFSKCSNKIGSYECPCCAGYEKDASGKCVESDSDVIEPDAPKCCICEMAICDQPGKVCGEDGKSYDNIRHMVISRCEEGLPDSRLIAIDYYGPCKGQCSPNLCPKYQVCVHDDKTGNPTCECEECSSAETESTEKVCSKELDVYPNICIFKHVQCMSDSEVDIYKEMKPCEDDTPGVAPVGPWSPWSECSVPCGDGTSTRTRDPLSEFDNLPPGKQAKYEFTQETECFEDPCPGSPCMNKNCTNKAFECVVDKKNEAVCVCPQCENIETDPVCGYVTGMVPMVRPVTWRSECHFKQFACVNRVADLELMHKGYCGATPVNCTRVPKYEYIKGFADDSYVSKKQVNVYECSGGCGQNKHQCCQAEEYDPVTVKLENAAGQEMDDDNVHIIKKCKCTEGTPGK